MHLHSLNPRTLRHHSQGPEWVFLSIRLDRGRLGRGRLVLISAEEPCLLKGLACLRYWWLLFSTILTLKSWATVGEIHPSCLSFFPMKTSHFPFGSDLCNFYQGHRKQSKARVLWIDMLALIALQYETLPVVPEPPSAICRSQECPFLHLSYLHLKHTHRITPSFLSYFVFQNWLSYGNEEMF